MAGRLFLDEIGDLPLNLQTKLLRIQEKRFVRWARRGYDTINVRIIAATNRDLRAAIKKREFREDLFYRIATVVCEVPPLRQRPEDNIIPLARFCACAQ
jgi:transcriptional regulator with GAF, ATPase, and Fis domain